MTLGVLCSLLQPKEFSEVRNLNEHAHSLSVGLHVLKYAEWVECFLNQTLEYSGLLDLWTDFPTLCYISKQNIHIKDTLVLFHF